MLTKHNAAATLTILVVSNNTTRLVSLLKVQPHVLVGSICRMGTSSYNYTEQLENEYKCIHDLSLHLYFAPPLQHESWVKHYNLFDWHFSAN